tara:strand:+ start:18361 stop:19056 length:696 start_codon:yes stop_codon:yes gene_type:complete
MNSENNKLTKLENNIGYKFKNKKILITALTHKSKENKKSTSESNQRYEFLGDAVLELVITKYLFDHYPKMEEGDLTKIRSSAVKQGTLVEIATQISIGDYISMSSSEEATGGRSKKSILEDSIEALIAGIYLDGGITGAERFIRKFFFPKIANLSLVPGEEDYKTRLQEVYAKKGKTLLYKDSSKGPDHRKLFFSEVIVGEVVIGSGEGHSKKSAQQAAAEVALKDIGTKT